MFKIIIGTLFARIHKTEKGEWEHAPYCVLRSRVGALGKYILSANELNKGLENAMPDQNATATTILDAQVNQTAIENGDNSYALILDLLSLDSSYVQLAMLVVMVFTVLKLLNNNTSPALAASNEDKGRKLSAASARIDALCEEGEELKQLKNTLQDDVIALSKEKASLSDQLKAEKEQAVIAETMIGNLKTCLATRDEQRTKTTGAPPPRNSQSHASYLRRMLQLPSKYQCHVEL